MADFNFAEFIHMGGYAKYVWSSWGITIIAMLWMIFSTRAKRKNLIIEIEQQLQQAEARQKRSAKNVKKK